MDFSSGGGHLAFSPALQRRVLVVVVDTEEEFDWTQPFDGRATAVTAMRHLHRIQDVCDEFGIRPCYAVDYSVATREEGRAPVRELLRSGRAELAAHLHPWINPPFVELVCARNSYPGNLDPRLEEAKLRELLAALAEGFGERPAVYKAARYGLGPSTPAVLERLGFVADVSRSPAFDLSADGGPDYSGEPDGLVWMGPRRQILGIPCTGSFVGFLGRRLGRIAYRQATRPALTWMRLPGILSRLRAVDRLYLSSEGFSLRDNVRLTRGLLRRGERVFGFAVHSPSAVPGHTPFVRDDADLRRFLDGMRRFFDFFLNTLGGVAMTPLELRRHVADQAPAPAQPLGAGRSPGSRPVGRAFARGSEG